MSSRSSWQPDAPKEFVDVFRAEFEALRRRRAVASGAGFASVETFPEAMAPREPHPRLGLVGLALSGGGIRSATFNLGLLQGLANLGLIPLFDYLSTVSGGGYIGSWYTCWRARTPDVSRTFPQGQDGGRPREIRHLWLFSNYLSPRKGLLAAEFWRAVGFYVRGLLVNLAVLLPVLIAVVFVTRLFHQGFSHGRLGIWLWGSIILGGGVIGVIFEWKYLRLQDLSGWWIWPSAAGFVGALCLGAFGILTARTLIAWRPSWFSQLPEPLRSPAVWAPPMVFLLTILLIVLAFAVLWNWQGLWLAEGLRRWLAVSCVAAVAVLVAAGGGMAWIAGRVSATILLAFLLLAIIWLTVPRGIFEDWSARMIGRLLAMTGLWMALFLVVLYGPSIPGTLRVASVSIASASTLFGLFARAPAGRGLAQQAKKWLLHVTPYLFLLGLLLAIVWLTDAVVQSSADIGCGGWSNVPCVSRHLLAVVALFLLGGILMDINQFSMHAFYRDRLIRAYLGASNPQRDGVDPGKGLREVTRRHPGDDVSLSRLHPWEKGGPYPLVNATLNLVGGEELWAQQRKADLFVLSPLFCGCALETIGYRETSRYAGDTLTLGKAMAISGAALSPEMGSLTSAPLAALMTLLNVRLGYWAPNPRYKSENNVRPVTWAWCLLRELFANTNDITRYCYLSDGGHHENLGLYELVRRGCRYIVCCDATADATTSFEDLSNAIRKIRADLDVDIEIDLDLLRPAAGRRMGSRHHAVGLIRYAKDGPEESTGTLVYIKASLTGDEPSDVLSYAVQHEPFPHQSTAEQFFGEAQFEAYRKLGEHVAWEVFEEAGRRARQGRKDVFDRFGPSTVTGQIRRIARLVGMARSPWEKDPEGRRA